MDSFDNRNFPVLASKVWNNVQATEEEMILAAREVIQFSYSILVIAYPKLKKLKAVPGSLEFVTFISVGSYLGASEKFEIEKQQFSPKNHLFIYIPMNVLGSARYAVFRIPTPKEEKIPEQKPIKLRVIK